MHTSLKFILMALLSLNANAHTLDEGLRAIDLGVVDLSSVTVKYNGNSGRYLVWDDPIAGYEEQLFRDSLFGIHNKNAQVAVDLGYYFERVLPGKVSKAQAKKLLKNIYSQPNVEFAYFSPRVSDAGFFEGSIQKSDPLSNEKETPDFEKLQFHLKAAPEGVDAFYAWDIPGGRGENIKVIDVETGINQDHEDYDPLFFVSELPRGVVDHGTAVAGEIVANRDQRGVTGIAYEAEYGFWSRLVQLGPNDYHENVAAVLGKAIAQLEAGDVLVLEMHSWGPAGSYIPVEYWQSVFDIVKYGVEEKGIICVAAGGNGRQNLDAKVYKGAFDRSVRDSGCILVGATERNQQKADFSNYGSRIDAWGDGREVVTTGYGDLYNGGPGKKYTKSFSGTSSAIPIVSGAVGVISSIAQQRGEFLSPLKIRAALHKTGTPSARGKKEQIGTLPNIKELVELLFKEE